MEVREMAESANVRLVLCPKCEELLPELPEFSLYKCGGCGAVLKAKGKGILENGHPKLPDDAIVGLNIEKDNSVKVSEVGIAVEKKPVENEIKTVLNEEIKSSSQVDSYTNDIRKRVEFRGISDSDNICLQDVARDKKPAKNYDLNGDRPEYAYFHENARDVKNPMDSEKMRSAADLWNERICESGPSRMHTRGLSGQSRINDFLSHEGLSSGDMRNPEQGERVGYQGYNFGAERAENLEIDRIDLLRRLDELRDQLSRSNEVAPKIKNRVSSPPSPVCYRKHNASYPESLTNSQALNNQPFIPDEMGTHCFSHSSKFVPCKKSYGSRPQELYARRGCAHEAPLYADHFRDETLWRPYHPEHMHQMHDQRFSHYYGEGNKDLYLPHRHEDMVRRDICSCRNCCGKNQYRTSVVDQQFCHVRSSQNHIGNTDFHHNLHPSLNVPQSTEPAILRQQHQWNSNELDRSHYPRKMAVSHGNKQVSFPIAGGAPFITCYNCFELVKLPRKHILMVKKQQKVKCGACSSVIFFEIGNKDIIAPISAHANQIPTEIDDGSIGMSDENVGFWNDGFYVTNRNTCSEDFADSQHKFSETEKKENSCGFEGHLNPISSSSSSQDDLSPDNRLSILQHSCLSPRELLDHCRGNIVENHLDKGNRSRGTGSRGTEENASIDRSSSLQKSSEGHAVASEIDVRSNELSNGYASQESIETNKEYQPKVSKGVESFLTNLMKKGFKDFKKLNQSGECRDSQVFVNGILVPERTVKKAEKLAGPIQPGEYWYDSKAGFWGVMGHSCLGIIMPNIEEFDHPIPADCAAGNTGVYVNGRELHQKDLDLLASRGLPITRNRSYIIEINGEVIDEQTGESLDCLGKLAPTVEKAKHGFGMKVPRFIAQTQN